jgi:hypothetical protein
LSYILKTGAYWKDEIEKIEVFFHLDGVQLSDRTDHILYDIYSLEYVDEYDINDIKQEFSIEPWSFNPDDIDKINNNLYKMTFTDIEPDFNIELQFPMPVISSITASSTLESTYNSYITDNLLDNNKDTAWVEGVDGDGIGEYLDIRITNSGGDYTMRAVDKIGIINGYTKNYSTFTQNNRIKKAKVEVIDKNYETHEYFIYLEDNQSTQFIEFDKPILTNKIKLTIQEVYKGTKYNDTCLSEIIVFTDKLQ